MFVFVLTKYRQKQYIELYITHRIFFLDRISNLSHLIMAEWQDHSILTLTAQVRDDDDEIPDDWENEPEEKVC